MMPIQPFRLTYHNDVPNDEIAWAMHVHHSHGQVEWCLDLLRRSYPDSRVVLINDGDGEDYAAVCRDYRCAYVAGQHLHRLETCHLYVRRTLETLVAGPETYCFKIDPDTGVWRRFRRLPAFSCMFGTLETITEGRLAEIEGPPNVQGGCIGMTRDVAEAILTGDVLTHEACVVRAKDTWARCEDMRRTVDRGQMCDDFVMSWAVAGAGVHIVHSTEVRSRWRRITVGTKGDVAIMHPCKRGASESLMGHDGRYRP
jgi:hypothetical protein